MSKMRFPAGPVNSRKSLRFCRADSRLQRVFHCLWTGTTPLQNPNYPLWKESPYSVVDKNRGANVISVLPNKSRSKPGLT